MLREHVFTEGFFFFRFKRNCVWKTLDFTLGRTLGEKQKEVSPLEVQIEVISHIEKGYCILV